MTSIQPTRISRAVAPASINVRIDALILHGFDARDRVAISASVEGELARMLATGPTTPPQWGSGGTFVSSTLPTGSFDVPAGAEPRQVGAGIAHSLAKSLFGTTRGVTR